MSFDFSTRDHPGQQNYAFFQRGDFNFAFWEIELKEEVRNDCNISKPGFLGKVTARQFCFEIN